MIIASTRPGRLGPAVARWFTTAAGREDVTLEVADLAEVGLPLLDEPEHPSSGRYEHAHTRSWSRRVAAADAFVVVTPEYNYGAPATLINAIDYLYREWAWKPVGFVSYGNTSAGTRGVQMTKQVATTVRMVPIGATVALRIADTVEDGEVRATDALDASARGVLDELVRVSRALRPMRDEPAADAPIDGLVLTEATPDDHAELLVLQRACFLEEAVANERLDLPQLSETVADVAEWARDWRVWCVRRDGRLVAAVRARAEGSTWDIGRLMVASDLAGNGIGRWLLGYAERQAPPGTTGYALYTGGRSHRNITLYQRAGYRLTDPPALVPGAVYLTKTPVPAA